MSVSEKQLEWREKQLAHAKSTPEYRFYLSRIPNKTQRGPRDPQTPRAGIERGKKVWTAVYLQWRRALHCWVDMPSERDAFQTFLKDDDADKDLFIPQQFVDCRVCLQRTKWQCSCCKVACCSELCQDELHPELK